MSFAVKMVSNLKSPNGDPYSVELSKNTILIGDNESGKSAIAESLQLARTGSAFGLLYRDKPIKDGSLLQHLIPREEETGRVRVMLDDGETCTWTMEEGKRPTRKGPNGASLSIAELHAVMGGNAETKIKFFWERLCKEIELGELLAALAEREQKTLLLVCPGDRSTVNLTEVLAKLGKLQREQSNIVKAGQIALESLGSVRQVDDDELKGALDAVQRGVIRDIIKVLYRDNKADPTIQAGPAIQYLVDYLGGKEAIRRIPDSEETTSELCEALLHKRLGRAAVAAKNGELRASELRDSLKVLKGALLKVMAKGLLAIGSAFAERVGSFLPEGDDFMFLPSNGTTFAIGLDRGSEEDKASFTALSGSTEARLLAAIASALAGPSDLIVVDDRMWDAGTLRRTMVALEKAEAQVVIMSTIKPKGRKRGAWKYISISRTPGQALEISDAE